MKKMIEKYELLSKDVEHQIGFIGDFYDMDFIHLEGTLKELKELQEQIKQKRLEKHGWTLPT